MLLKNPTWLSLIPGSLQWHSVDAATEAAILSALQVEGRVHLALLEHPQRQHYLVETEGGRCLFIKNMSVTESDSIESAESIARWLYEQGCCTPLLMDVINCRLSDGQRQLWVYLYVQGRFCRPTLADVNLFGGSIAALHQCLKRNPQVITWHRQTHAHYQQLSHIRERVLSGALQHVQLNPSIYQLFEQFDFAYCLQPGAIPLHGDLRPDNCLVTLDKNLCFLNFKRTPISFQRPINELVYVMAHLILTRIEDDRSAFLLATTLLDAYMRAGGEYQRIEDDKNALFFMLLVNYAELLLNEQQGDVCLESQWEKLRCLFDILSKRQSLFTDIMSEFN